MQTDQWLGLELRHLIALRAVADEGTFGAAARKLGYTQSAISQQIATLERIVGQKLIERPGGPRPVSLTDAGRLLLGHAEGITARLQAAQADLQTLRATGKEPRIVFRSDHNETVQGIAAAGMGVALVPRLTVDQTDRRVAVIELGDRLPPRQIALAWHRDRHRTRAAEAFVEAARTLCAGYEQAAAAAAAA